MRQLSLLPSLVVVANRRMYDEVVQHLFKKELRRRLRRRPSSTSRAWRCSLFGRREEPFRPFRSFGFFPLCRWMGLSNQPTRPYIFTEEASTEVLARASSTIGVTPTTMTTAAAIVSDYKDVDTYTVVWLAQRPTMRSNILKSNDRLELIKLNNFSKGQ